MCTLILANQVIDDAPLLFGANRDERFGRPSEGPRLHESGDLRVLAPRDLKAGGTWLGLNEAEVLVAITNRFGKPPEESRRSRGELVDRALEEASAAEAAEVIAALSASDYNGFHLLCADRDAAYIVWSDGESMHRETLEPGLLVLTERSFGAAENARKERVLAQCQQLLADGKLNEKSLKTLLSRCEVGSIDSTCVNLPEMNYGTRSSTILRLGKRRCFLHARGAPCSARYRDMSVLLDRLLGKPAK